MTVAPALASPRANNAISAGYPGEIMRTFTLAQPSSTRTPVTRRHSAAVTTPVSGCVTMT
jgi:hypothetical protein